MLKCNIGDGMVGYQHSMRCETTTKNKKDFTITESRTQNDG